MKIQVELSLYPLRSERLSPAINAFSEELRQAGIDITSGPMSAIITGESKKIFSAVGRAFDKCAGSGDLVLVLKASNACPKYSLEED